MKSLLIGIFTHHVVTKVVSLLLAIVLFVVTQQSISDTQRIEELTIKFELDAESSKLWVLLNDTVVVRNMMVTGLRKDLVDNIGSLSRDSFVVTKVLSTNFIRDNRVEGEIRVDAKLCAQERIPWELGEDFTVELKESPPALLIQQRIERTFRPTLADAMEERLTLPESSRFRGPAGALLIQPKWVTPDGVEITAINISGPANALPGPPEGDALLPLKIRVRALSALLSGKSPADARGPLPIASIDWEGSGCRPSSLLHVTAPENETIQSLAVQTLKFRCERPSRSARWKRSRRSTGSLAAAAAPRSTTSLPAAPRSISGPAS
ncbi:MAG: hypothetical protein ACYTGZ_13320 [Planctomycetota bacterium]